jgi:hypothetical protein
MQLDGLVELCLACADNELQRFLGIIKCLLIYEL